MTLQENFIMIEWVIIIANFVKDRIVIRAFLACTLVVSTPRKAFDTTARSTSAVNLAEIISKAGSSAAVTNIKHLDLQATRHLDQVIPPLMTEIDLAEGSSN